MKFRLRIFLAFMSLIGTLSFEPANANMSRGSENVTLTVFAASSLSQTFTLLGNQFVKTHPAVNVQFSFLSSSTLANQINSGAPVDIFASASETDMRNVISVIPKPVFLAANRVVLAFPKNGTFHINKLVDLNQKGLKWIQCAHSAPCGVVADASFASFHKVISKPVSYEPNVASAVTKLLSGEVDAAVIYHSDFIAHQDLLREVRFPDIPASTTRYQIGVLNGSKNSALAQSFVNSVTSPQGRKVFIKAGFVRVA